MIIYVIIINFPRSYTMFKSTITNKIQSLSPKLRWVVITATSLFIAMFVLSLGLKLIYIAANSQFEKDVKILNNNLNNIIKRYEEGLFNINSFVVSNKYLSKRQFDKYLDSINVEKDYPSMSHIHFVERVLSSQVHSFYENIKNDYEESGLMNNKLRVQLNILENNIDLERNEHYIIKYIRGNEYLSQLGVEVPVDNFKYFSQMNLNSKLVKSENFTYLKDNDYKGPLVAINLPSYVEDNLANILYLGSTGAFIKLDNNLFSSINNNLDYLKFNIINSDENVIYSKNDEDKSKRKNIFNHEEKMFFHEKDFIIGQIPYNIQIFSNQFPPNVNTNTIIYVASILSFLFTFYLLYGIFKRVDYIKNSKNVKSQFDILSNQANTDQLTGLYNRRYFFSNLSEKIESKPQVRMFIFFIDLDGFKLVNDNLGHSAGDELLQQYTYRLKRLKEIEMFNIYRIGGDEFILLLEEDNYKSVIDLKKINFLANSVLKLTNEPFVIKGETCYLSQSIGISEYPSDGTTPSDLFKNSDLAMYEAKKNGKNCYVLYSEELREKVREKNNMLAVLMKAIENNEFYLAFQPKMKKVNGVYQMEGAEALIRWKNEELGLVSPSVFIPLAEESGLISKIDNWLIHQVGKSFIYWESKGIHNMKISINVSARQFSNDMLPELFTNVLKDYNVKPQNIIIEITESATVKEPQKAKKILEKFRSYGFGVSIDDFGTGYSSMTYLKQFPSTEIKIDKSFTDDIVLDEHDRIIIEGICSISHNLKLNVVIEGVETYEQVKWIENTLKNVLIQGYYFSKPLVIDDFIIFSKKNKIQTDSNILPNENNKDILESKF